MKIWGKIFSEKVYCKGIEVRDVLCESFRWECSKVFENVDYDWVLCC